jgi:acyl-CoA thioesterase
MDAQPTISEDEPDELAQACAKAMWVEDQASQGLGMIVERVSAGEAIVSMKIRPDMTNGHGICHGGFIFTLADSAFAFACNTYNQRTVAQQCAVTFLQPGRRGDTLTAHAVERIRTGRSGIYDVTVRDSRSEIIAEFRGHSRTIAGALLSPGTDEVR